MIKELFKDLVKYLPSKIVPTMVGIIAVPIITRLFPPGDYGNFVIVTATIAVLSLIAVAWIGSSIIRFSPMYASSNEMAAFHSMLFKLALASIGTICVIFVGVLFLVQNRISENLYTLLRIGVLVFTVTSLSGVLLQLLRAERKVAWFTSFSIWTNVVGLGLGIALVVLFHFGVDGLLWGALISTAVALPLLWRISLGKLSLTAGHIRSPITREIAHYGVPAMGITLLAWVLSLSDRYLLEFFRGSAEVGIYSASYIISEKSIFFITSLFLLSSTPIAFTIWEDKGEEASKEFVAKLTRYYLLIGLPATVGLSILAKPIVSILIAPEYLEGYGIVPLVASGAFLMGIAQRFTIGLAFHKKNHLSLLCYVVAGALNIGLNFLFIPRYGYWGAALATFISYACSTLLTAIVSRRFFTWDFPYRSMGKAACATAIMSVAVYACGAILNLLHPLNLIAGIAIGIAVYCGALFILGEIHPNEKKTMKELLSR